MGSEMCIRDSLGLSAGGCWFRQATEMPHKSGRSCQYWSILSCSMHFWGCPGAVCLRSALSWFCRGSFSPLLKPSMNTSEACVALYLHAKSLSIVKSNRCPRDATRLRVELRGPAAKVSWVIFCSGRLLGCLEIQNGHKQLGMERMTTSSLVPFQPFQPGRNKLRHALSDGMSGLA